MAATTKRDLLKLAEKEFAKLDALLNEIPDALKLQKDEEDTSPKDIVGHRAHWIDLFSGWYKDGKAGHKVYFPAKGYKWNQLKSYNSALRDAQSGMSWQDARSVLKANHASLLTLIENLPEDELYGGPMKGANNDWTVGRWAEASGPSHYRSATKYLRKRLKAFNG